MSKFYDIPADYMALLPDFLQGIEEMEQLAKISNPYIDALNALIKKHTDNTNILYADADGIARWEKILKVSPPIGGTLEDRRNALLAKIRGRGVINMETLRNVVETYLGVPVDIEMWWDAEKLTWGQVREQYKTWGNVSRKRWGDFYRTGEPYVIYIYYRGTVKIPDLAPLYEMIYELIPANLIVKIQYRWQTWGEVKDNFGLWYRLKGQTWGTIRKGTI